MPVQITIIGLGQIGTSFGLALKEHTEKIYRVGHDKLPAREQAAKNMGAVDQVQHNLYQAVKDADIVLLALPLSEIRATLELIGKELRPSTVLMETAPVKAAVAGWVAEMLSPQCDYIGLLPTIHPAHLLNLASGQETAHAELFRQAPMLIISPPKTRVDTELQNTGRAIKAAADLAELVGALPLFIDLAEADGLVSATHTLPRLMAAALLNVTVGQPGWQEARKLTGPIYAEAVGPMGATEQDAESAAESLFIASVHNKANILRVLDYYLSTLQNLRADIARSEIGADTGDIDPLHASLIEAHKNHQRWWQERSSPTLGSGGPIPNLDVPKTDIFSRLLGSGEFPKRNKKN